MRVKRLVFILWVGGCSVVIASAVALKGLEYYVINYYLKKPCVERVECVEDAFEKVAFGAELNPGAEKKITKWMTPISIYVQSDQEERFVPMVKEHVALINKNINLPVTVTNGTDEPADFIVVFSKDFDRDVYKTYSKSLYKLYNNSDGFFKDYEDIKQRNPICFGLGRGDKQLRLAIIFIPSEAQDILIKSCIAEEITQALGLPSDSPTLMESRFNDKSHYTYLTKLDWLLLRILYHPLITPRMPWEEVQKIFDQVYEDVKNQRLKKEK